MFLPHRERMAVDMKAYEEKMEELKKMVAESSNIVFFGGAGVSTESGIPDFRSVDGLYNQQYQYPTETILSHTFYRRNPEEFFHAVIKPLIDDF